MRGTSPSYSSGEKPSWLDMNILALESSGQAGSVAAACDERLLAEIPLAAGQRSAQSMAPAIAELIVQVGWKITDIGLVAVTVGPGSFTGLRVGVATAKTIAYAIGARCVGINTLSAIAAACSRQSGPLAVAMDAQRGEVFAAVFEWAKTEWQIVGEPTIVDNEDWLAGLRPGMAVCGPALGKLGGRLPHDVTVVDAALWSPQAASVARLAWERHQAGDYDDVFKLLPLYLRKSAAEEKREKVTKSE
jgi:tRNA threonylcarbamoyladenosine biosynthesis protein TsaB